MRLSKEIIRNAILDLLIAIVVFIIDIFDLPSRIIPENFRISCDSAYALVVDYLGNNGTHAAIIAVALLVIIVLCIILDAKRITETFVNKSFNNADKLIVNSLLICGLLFRIYEIIGCDVSIKMNLLLLFVVIAAMYLAIRFAFVCRLRLKEKPSNIISIADLYNNNLPEGSNFLFIEDTETDQDIIGQDVVVEKLYNIATSYANDKSLTVSLVGPWGSGKSSVLNHLKKKIEGNKAQSKRIVFIDSFNPWNYDNAKEMARSFAEAILSELGLSSNSQAVIELANSLLQIFPEQHVSKFFGIFKIKGRNNDPIRRINNYLSGQNKQLVIVLDNLERGEPETIIRLLKAIKNDMGLKSVIYILSYDDKIMNDILADKNLDRKYLEKFSQLTVKMPEIDAKKKVEITRRCIENYLSRTEEPLNDAKELAGRLAGAIRTPRELLLIINSIFASNSNHVNASDALVFNILARISPKLVDEIRAHPDIYTYNESYILLPEHSDSGEKARKTYIDTETAYFETLRSDTKLWPEVEKCKPYINFLFPQLSSFIAGAGQHLWPDLSMNEKSLQKAEKERRMRIKGFFDVYYAQIENDSVDVVNAVEDLLVKAPDELLRSILNYIKGDHEAREINIYDKLKDEFSELDEATAGFLASGLLDEMNNFSRNKRSFWLSEREEAVHFLTILLNYTSDNVFRLILEILKKSYGRLKELHYLEKWSKDLLNKTKFDFDRYQDISKTLSKMRETIVNDDISLYETGYYNRLTVRKYLFQEDKERIVKYIQKILNKTPKENRILIIADAITYNENREDGYEYVVDASLLNSVFSKEVIDKIIKNAKESELKECVRAVIDGAENKSEHSDTIKVFMSAEKYDFNKMANDYIQIISKKKQANNTSANK